MASRVSERGQITIDRAIREHLGIKPRMVAYQRVVDGRLEVIFLLAPHRRSLYGVFQGKGGQPPVADGDQLEEAVADALAE